MHILCPTRAMMVILTTAVSAMSFFWMATKKSPPWYGESAGPMIVASQ